MSDPTARFCPYNGLQPYTEADRAYFFGRERDREIIIANLYAAPLTVLYGASGVGKSSVLLAGVVPALKEITPRIVVVVFRDWQNPEFKSALKTTVLEAVAKSLDKEVKTDLRLPFDEFLEGCLQGLRCQIFFILDQFEEYFFYHPPSSAAESFEAEFAKAVNRVDVRANFLMAVREDGLSKLDRFQGRIPRLLGNLLRLEHLNREAAADAIRKPLEEFNRHLPADESPIRIEEALVEALLQEVRAGQVSLNLEGQEQASFQPGDAPIETRIETPFLQMVLTRLWDEEMATGSRQLRLSTFAKLGRTKDIANKHLVQEMRHLKEAEQVCAARLLFFLVAPSGTKIAQDASALAAWAKVPEGEARDVLTRLSRDMRVLRRVDAPGQADRYEIFHDLLGPAILDWRKRFDSEQTERQLKLERRRVFFLRVGIVALLLLLCGMVYGFFYIRYQKRAAEAHELALSAISALQVDPELGLDLAVHAARFGDSSDTDYALRKSLIECHLRRVLTGHDHQVTKTAFSPDGKLVATTSRDATARIWEVATGKLLETLEDHSSVDFDNNGERIVTARIDGTGIVRAVNNPNEPPVTIDVRKGDSSIAINSLLFSPDGGSVITASTNNQAQIWDASTGKLTTSLNGHAGIDSAAFSHDGRYVVTTGADDTARLWLTSGSQVWLGRHNARVSTAVFSPDDKYVVTAGFKGDDSAHVWEVSTGRQVCQVLHKDAVESVAVCPKGEYIVTASHDKTARVWRLKTGELVSDMRDHQDKVRYATFSHSGTEVVTTSDDGTAIVWEALTGNVLAVLRGHTGTVWNAAFSPDDRSIVTGSQDKTARLWDVSSVSKVITVTNVSGSIESAAFSGGGDYIVTAGRFSEAEVWSARDGQRVSVFGLHKGYINSVNFGPDDNFIVTASRDHTAQVWETATARRVSLLNKHSEYVNSANFSSDGQLVVTASDDKTAIVWDWRKQQALAELEGSLSFVNSAAFSPDGKYVVTASDDKTAIVWDWRNKKQVVTSKHALSVTKASFSPNGDYIVTASRDGTSRVWPWRENKPVTELRHQDVVNSATFNLDGGLVVTAGGPNDRTARVWKSPADDPVATLRGHTGGVSTAFFDPSGKVVVTASLDGTVRLWSARTGEVLSTLRRHSYVVNSAVFDHKGRAIVSAVGDGTAHIYACEACGEFGAVLELAKDRLKHLKRSRVREATGQ